MRTSPAAGPNSIGSPARVEVVAVGAVVVTAGVVVVVWIVVLVVGASTDVVVDEGATAVLVVAVSTSPQAATSRLMVTRPSAVRLMVRET
jgi:hypothetical protein